MSVTLNARAVERLKPDAGQRDVWDATIKGLGLRITANGTKTWTVRYRSASGSDG